MRETLVALPLPTGDASGPAAIDAEPSLLARPARDRSFCVRARFTAWFGSDPSCWCFLLPLSVPVLSVSRAVKGWDLRTSGGAWALVGGAGRVRADAQPYLGPRSGVAPGRRHDG